MNDIIGHILILQFFSDVIKNGTLSHAYCFVGHEGVGKRSVAQHIASILYAMPTHKLALHPDFFSLTREKDIKTDKTKKDISIEQAKGLIDFLSTRAALGGYKVVIIEQAEKLNTHAANALLKTVEEPRGQTIIFLLVTDERKLPRTIASRSQIIYFHPVVQSDIEVALIKRGEDEKKAKEYAEYSRGLPGLALCWHADPESFSVYRAERERYQNLIGKTFYDKLSLVAEFFEERTDHIAARDRLLSVLDIWLAVTREALIKQENRAVALSQTQAVTVSEKIFRAKKMLTENVHPRLLIEQILLSLP